MDKIKEIYQNLMQETDEMKYQRKILEEKVEFMLRETGNQMDREAYEAFRDRFYEVAMVAEENNNSACSSFLPPLLRIVLTSPNFKVLSIS